jgi:hypothetical protein
MPTLRREREILRFISPIQHGALEPTIAKGLCALAMLTIVFCCAIPVRAEIGIAFDQIEKSGVRASLPLPTDFDRLWNDAIASQGALKSVSLPNRTAKVGFLLRIASLGNKIRFEDVLDNIVELDQVGQGRATFLVWTQKRTVQASRGFISLPYRWPTLVSCGCLELHAPLPDPCTPFQTIGLRLKCSARSLKAQRLERSCK